MINKMPGHEFLAKLGKRRLRPGGKKGTDFLIDTTKTLMQNNKNLNVLEVSCNRGYSLINIYKKLKPQKLIGVDISPLAINKAKELVGKKNLEDKIEPMIMNAFDLKFDNKFDIIINEAMLTMYQDKTKLLKEYAKVLSNQGYLLTHDICVSDYENWEENMKNIINVKPYPLTEQDWIKKFDESGLEVVDKKILDFTLTNPIGLIKDEGLFRTIKIIINSKKKENKEDFKNMRKFFKNNKKKLKAICFITRIKNNGK